MKLFVHSALRVRGKNAQAEAIWVMVLNVELRQSLKLQMLGHKQHLVSTRVQTHVGKDFRLALLRLEYRSLVAVEFADVDIVAHELAIRLQKYVCFYASHIVCSNLRWSLPLHMNRSRVYRRRAHIQRLTGHCKKANV